jgi:hypothetical protein
MNDFISLVIDRAIESFGGKNDGMFNAACFSTALASMSGVNQTLDGRMVRAILCGRQDVEVLRGGCHYRALGITQSKGGG